jgi:DNA-3-methyladenine glycosylase II
VSQHGERSPRHYRADGKDRQILSPELPPIRPKALNEDGTLRNMLREDHFENIHAQLLDIAGHIAVPLETAIRAIGPSRIPDRQDKGLGYFLSRAVIGQQLSTKSAGNIWGRIEDAAIDAEKDIPELFDGTCIEVLQNCGVSRNKIKALGSICQAHKEGLLCANSLRQLDHDQRSEQLLSIWGIGQWTCDMASIFYCRCPDIWPEGDVTVQKTFRRLIGRRNPDRASAKFAPYRSYLALAMWNIVDSSPAAAMTNVATAEKSVE